MNLGPLTSVPSRSGLPPSLGPEPGRPGTAGLASIIHSAGKWLNNHLGLPTAGEDLSPS